MTSGFSRGRSKRYAYYCCRNAGCRSRASLPLDSVHSEFTEFLDRIGLKPEVLRALGDAIVTVAHQRRVQVSMEQSRVRADLDRLDRQRKELIRMRAAGLITDQEFLAQRSILADRRMAIEARTDPEQIDAESVRSDLHEIEKPVAELRITWQALLPAFQRRFNRMVLPVGYVNGRIGTAERALLFSTLGDFRDGKSIGVSLTGENLNRLMQEISGLAGILRGQKGEKLAA
jgi:hypothetical protein